jgi:hypothetical protein
MPCLNETCLYTHCVDVRLANGTVLHQDVVPTLPFCKASFIQTWHDNMVKRYEMEVSIICCEWNRCNGPNARAAFGTKYGGSNSTLVWSLPILLITVISWWTHFNITCSSNLTKNEICKYSATKSNMGDNTGTIHHHFSSYIRKCQNQLFNFRYTNMDNTMTSPNEKQQ